jgi:diguanylate cyclase (GGDEF)-like protein/PAS domain S-box-containing protein
MEGALQLDAYRMSLSGLAPLATAIAMLLLGVFVVARERGSRESVLFGVLAVTVTVWLGCFSAMYLANAERVALFWAKTAYLGITFIAPAVLSFAVAVTRDWPRRRRLVAASWLVSTLLCAASVGTDALFRDLEHYPWGYYPRFRWLGVPFLAVFFVQLGLALRQYWVDHRAAQSAIHRQRARWLLVAFSIAYLGCIDYVPAYGVQLYPFGYVPVFAFIVLSAWTIRRFRLVDFTPELAAREILATVADPLIVCDGEGRIRLLNPAAASVLGRRPEEIAGRPIADLVPPPDQGRLAALLAGGETRDQSIDLRSRDGGAVPVELAVSPLRDRGGAVVGSVLVARDARPHLRAQAALAASEARYRALFEANPIPMWVSDRDTLRFLAVNDAAVRDYGYSRDEFLTMTIRGLLSPTERDGREAVAPPPHDLRPATERRLRTRDGRTLEVEVTWHALDLGGRPALLELATDVTQRNRAMQALRASEERFRAVAETAAEGIVTADVRGHIVYVNDALERMFGYGRGELAGQPLTLLMPERYHEAHQRGLLRLISTGESRVLGKRLALHGRRRDGGEFPLELSLAAWSTLEGRFFTGILADTSEQQRAAEALRQSEETFRTFTESAPAAIFICEGERFRYMNQAAESMTGYSAADLLAMRSWEVAAPGSRDVLRAMLVPEQGELVPARREVRLLTYPHGERWVDLTVAPLASHGRAAAMITAYDVTESKLAHDMVRASERRLRDMLENVKLAALTLDTEGLVTYCNDYLLELLGCNMEELVGSAWFQRWVPAEQCERLQSAFSSNLAAGTAAPHDEYEIVTRDGDRRLVSWSHTVLRGLHGEVVGTASIGADITERKRVEERLAHEALHDSLTGLPNRALFMDRLRSALARARRRDDYRLAVLFLDLDRFKVVNDSLGHLQGDQLLIQVSRRLESCVRPGDTIARLGGDEFTILLEELEQTAEAVHAGTRIRGELAAPFDLAGHEIFVTASVGIALGAARYVHPEDLLRDADTALHSAKAQGKTAQQVFDTPMHERAVAALQLENDLRRALDRDEYRLHYQPIVELAGGRLIGFEALVRWQHPERGLMAPDSFITVAEETGLILPLGDWVLGEALRQLKVWERQVPRSRELALTVNLSSRQFAQPDLVARIGSALRAAGVAAGRLKVEITESLIVQNQDTAADMLRGIKDLGCSVCLDDFGTGYSSLNYLLRFPIDTLKVDRSFLADLGRGSRNSEIVLAVIGLAQRLGLGVIAEGVENERQRAHLVELGCVFGQGFLFSKPLDAERAGTAVEVGEVPPPVAQ